MSTGSNDAGDLLDLLEFVAAGDCGAGYCRTRCTVDLCGYFSQWIGLGCAQVALQITVLASRMARSAMLASSPVIRSGRASSLTAGFWLMQPTEGAPTHRPQYGLGNGSDQAALRFRQRST